MEKLPIAKANSSIKQAMRVIDRGGLGIAFVVDTQDRLVGVATDGDLRRALLKGLGLDEHVSKVMNRNFVALPAGLSRQELQVISQQHEVAGKIPREGVMAVPLCDKRGKVAGIYFAHSHQGGVSERAAPARREVLKKILVTGGAGYIGSVLVRRLLESGYSVRVLDKFLYSNDSLKGLNNARLEVMRGDVLDVPTLISAVKDVGAVVHLAEIVGDPATALDPELTVANNIVATAALAQVCKYFQVNRFIYASSCSVYGATEKEWVDENSPTFPVSLYARAKLESEKAITAMADENFSPTILRFSTVYGLSPRMRFDLVLNVMTADAIKKGKISVSGGSQWRPLVHVADVCQAIQLSLEKGIGEVGGKVFNVGSDENNFRIVELAKEIQRTLQKLGHKVELSVAAENKDARSYRVSFKKIHHELGYRQEHPVDSAVKEIAAEFSKGRFSDYSTNKRYSNFLSWKSEKHRLRRKISGAVSRFLPNWLG